MTLSRGKKCALAMLCVLAVGASMLFRRSPTPPSPSGGEVRKALTRRLPNPRGAGEHAQLLQSFEEKMPRVPTAATLADPDTRSREFAAHPSRSFHPGAALFEPTDNLQLAQPPQEEMLADAQIESSPLAPAPPRTHLVVDGDTLAKLAARFLGSSDRYGEIFAANRPLLTTPDLLPIGARLTIPPRQRPAPPVELSPEETAGSPGDDDQLPRLDIEPVPAFSANPLDREGQADDDMVLAPVPKAAPREKE